SANGLGRASCGAPGHVERALRDRPVCRGGRAQRRARPLRARLRGPGDAPAAAAAAPVERDPGEVAMSLAERTINADSVDAAITSRMSARAFLPTAVPRQAIEH